MNYWHYNNHFNRRAPEFINKRRHYREVLKRKTMRNMKRLLFPPQHLTRRSFHKDLESVMLYPILIVPEHLLVRGSSADAFVLSDGESYAARNGVESVTALVGNELSGHFRLRLRGHTSGRIPFNSSENEMKARLEELPNVGTVDVQRSGP